MNASDKISLHFLGAAGTVTGSKYLIEVRDKKIMVDCGLFQGLKKLRQLNWDYLPVNVAEIDAVVLTHGHMDHTGYLPRLIKMGYKNAIYGTAPTLDIAEIILRDSAKIQEEEADRANKEGYSKHNPSVPLYDLTDAEKAIHHFKALPEGEWITLFDQIEIRFQYNGHIIGATFIEMNVYGKRFVFSGDIGRKEDLLMRPYKKPQKADILFIESTYGDRIHPKENLYEKIEKIVNHTVQKGGTLIIPSFAVERTQTLMYILWQLKKKGLIPEIPLIMDSPMGANVLKVFHNHKSWHKLSSEECAAMCDAFTIVQEYRETWEVIDDKRPKIVIAGSGMMTGGRVLTYLQQYVGLPETSVLVAGFQADGTRGKKLLNGCLSLKIYGKYYEVKAEVFEIQTLSAHADQAELIDWMSEISNTPEQVFIIHGEAHAADTFRVRLTDTYNWNCYIPELYEIKEFFIDVT
ncbi:MBL fold metallo-hydrolase RNA specificity domain-containing protein [Lishizhenia tianjinensis]|nr:MBL fold metallo-hydrolase [Lishizhenia tianjinensis]